MQMAQLPWQRVPPRFRFLLCAATILVVSLRMGNRECDGGVERPRHATTREGVRLVVVVVAVHGAPTRAGFALEMHR